MDDSAVWIMAAHKLTDK